MFSSDSVSLAHSSVEGQPESGAVFSDNIE